MGTALQERAHLDGSVVTVRGLSVMTQGRPMWGCCDYGGMTREWV